MTGLRTRAWRRERLAGNGSKAEHPVSDVDGDVLESRLFEPCRKRDGVNRGELIGQMQQSHSTAIEAVRSHKRSARAEHAMDLAKHPILQRGPWQMMEHRERCRRRKCGIRKGQLRRIALNDADTGVSETSAQAGREIEIKFNRSHAP